MISHSHQFVFVHIPKTGGTSVANALGSYGIQQQGKINFGSIYFKHASAYNLERMMGEEYEKYLRFTIVRNPWDWAVSNFHYNGGLHRPFIEGSTVAQSSTQPDWVKAMGFKKWLKWWLETLKPSQKKMITKYFFHSTLLDEVSVGSILVKCLIFFKCYFISNLAAYLTLPPN